MDASSTLDHESIIFQRQANVFIEDSELSIKLTLTESGSLNTEVLSGPSDPIPGLVHDKIEGETYEGEKLIARHVFCDSDELSTSMSISSIEVIGNQNWTSEGNEVKVCTDVLGFQYTRHEKLLKECIPLLSKSGTISGDSIDWHVDLKPMDTYMERVGYIRKYYSMVRTSKAIFSLSGLYGDLQRVGGFVSEEWGRIAWMTAFIEGTIPLSPKIQIYNEKGEMIYAKITNTQSNIGSGCDKNGLLIISPSEIEAFIDRSYENFRRLSNDLNIKSVIGYYIDSLNKRRPVEPRFVNLCIGIEMLANQYGRDRGCTPKQIRFLMKDLGIRFHDLLRLQGSFPANHVPQFYQEYRNQLLEYNYTASPTELLIHDKTQPSNEKVVEYFWYKSRNHVIHGRSGLSDREIYDDFEALIVLMRRILRELLLDGSTNGLRGLENLERNEYESF